MVTAAMAYGTQIQPAAALTLPTQKKALRACFAGPVLFYRERKIALRKSSNACSGLQTKPATQNSTGPLFGLLRRIGVCLVRGHAFVLKQLIHARNCAAIFIGFGVRFAICHWIRFKRYFTDFGIRGGNLRDFNRASYVAAVFGAEHRQRIAVLGLRHGNCGCSASDKNKACDGKCDFAAFGSAHCFVSLDLINRAVLMTGRGVFRIPLMGNLPDHCDGKRDQLCNFQGTMCVKTPQSSPNARHLGERFLNASLGDHLRRVAHHDGLAYVRRNPIFDGDTAR